MPVNLSSDLVPIIYKKDIDSIAAGFLMKYFPEALEKPMPLPVEDIAELSMGLEIDYVSLGEDKDILGMMIFSDGEVQVYDREKGRYIRRHYRKGSLLVESSTLEFRGRDRFTIAHEMIHWELHQLRFMAVNPGDRSAARACRCGAQTLMSPRTSEEWIEWQADSLAAAILMPENMFRKKALELGAVDRNAQESSLIDCLAGCFGVSRKAAKIRMKNLGLYLL